MLLHLPLLLGWAGRWTRQGREEDLPRLATG